MTTKKKTLFLLLMITGLLLCACGGNVRAKDTRTADSKVPDSSSPEYAAECVMTSLKALDLNTFNAYTDNYIATHRNWIGVPTSREYRIFNELLQPALVKGKHYKKNLRLSQKLMENLSWEITDVRQTRDTAQIDISITNIDMSLVMENYTLSLLENMEKSEGMGMMVSLMKDLYDLTGNMDDFLSIMDSTGTNKTCTIDVTLSAQLEKGQWIIHISEEFINAFMGNIDSGEFSEETLKKMEMLENSIDEKADKWAEEFSLEFEERIEGLFD